MTVSSYKDILEVFYKWEKRLRVERETKEAEREREAVLASSQAK